MEKIKQWFKQNPILFLAVTFLSIRIIINVSNKFIPTKPLINDNSANPNATGPSDTANPMNRDAVCREVASNVQLLTLNYRKRFDFFFFEYWNYSTSTSTQNQMKVKDELNKLNTVAEAQKTAQYFAQLVYSFDSDTVTLKETVNDFISSSIRSQIKSVILGSL